MRFGRSFTSVARCNVVQAVPAHNRKTRPLFSVVSRSQSAMEYLMTYGWSILIIAVILGAMFQLGVFNSVNLGPRAQAGNCKVFRAPGVVNLVGTCTGVLPQSVAQFNGQTSYINLQKDMLQGTVFTLSSWIEISAFAGTGGVAEAVVSNGRYTLFGPTQSYQGYTNTFSAAIETGFSNDAVGTVTQNGFQTNVWYHVVMVYDGSQSGNANRLKVYVNGVNKALVYDDPIPAGTYDAGLPALIGGSATYLYFNGAEANIQIYNISLDANQVQALYLKGIGAAPVDPSHIVGWWPLNGDANDYSGNNNSGAASNVFYTGAWLPGYSH
jgi:Concanavalin A-like lectin/glucanases superfamily